MKITMVVPTYNEYENLPRLVKEVLSLPLEDISLLIVDDNSPDGTGELAEQLGKEYNGKVKVLHRPGKLGLGTAYNQGFQRAIADGADYIGQMDADFSHPIEKIPEMVDRLKNYDVVIGSRYVRGGKLDEKWPFYRKWLSGFGNFYARTILGLQIKDVTGGFKIWRRETLEAMPLDRIKANGYMFQVEMNYVSSKLGFKPFEIPIYFKERTHGTSKMNFAIQKEAAIRTLKIIKIYKDIKPIRKK
ncbi:polyprenol monophosphomannose synthase [Flexilinea flocculi]|jgi:dolichol-phosphate mannosyltransferase|uniref:Glycosyltransferase n=1 Tax=Flexilinea flocculi TaxID=1678840 RepID=A0A0S7BUU6_9CHLR|nr:polyprenol monophosphomannose synthase [Flexilinea flocculi]NMB93929.1 polyprenol monophosphomannose synthase [Flexilinea flocculi]GAP40592.1 glycosyltransferase [Flexilinea flocculi]